MNVLIRSLLAIVCFLLLVILVQKAEAQSPHAANHGTYMGWKTPNGGSCCNENDCRGVKHRVTPAGLELEIENQWVPVPANKIRPYASPDEHVHACVIPDYGYNEPTPVEKRILCVVLPFNG